MRKTSSYLKIFTEKETLAMALLLFFLIFIPSIIAIIMCVFVDPTDAFSVACMLMGCCVIIGIVLIIEARKWAATVSLSKEGIEYKRFLHKAEKNDYSDFPHVTKAYRSRSAYSHSIQLSKKFIVISSRPLNETEIYCLTNVPNSSDLVKIEFSKKNYQKLLNILPESHKKQLIEQFADLASK